MLKFKFTLLILVLAATSFASVDSVPIGVRFTHEDSGAGQVFLAGSFNDWSSTANPMTDNDGTWTIIMALKAGEYQYKFVVDGNWMTDPGNPDSAPDSFGGTNSVITVNAKGKLVPTVKDETTGPNTDLSARLKFSGRYLARYTAFKNVDSDPRFRMTRPEQKIDMNFTTVVTDVVTAYSRIRLDNTTRINMNSIHSELNEASVDVHPGPFHVNSYWDMEALQLSDPLGLGGDIDLAGTIMDDHLLAGKGTAGITFDSDPIGFHYDAFFADVHDLDYYNSIEIYDNIGRDVFGSRLSRKHGKFTFGLPMYMERDLLWVDFSQGTDIPAMEQYLAENDDSSTWYEFDNFDMRAGLDVTYELPGNNNSASLEFLYNDHKQRFVVGNESGPNNTNGPVDIELMTRNSRIWHAEFTHAPENGHYFSAEHTMTTEFGAEADESYLQNVFRHESVANKRTYLLVMDAQPARNIDYSEITWSELKDDSEFTIWLQRYNVEQDYQPVGQLSPAGNAVDNTTALIASAKIVAGSKKESFGRMEIEAAVTQLNDDSIDESLQIFEIIGRSSRKITRRMSFITDVRLIEYHTGDGVDRFVSPYLGFQFVPHKKLELVFAMGVDPMDFGIDYNGRQIGRWLNRRLYMDQNPGASTLDAEQFLADTRALGIRANFIF